jgi:hypothetical protein
MRLAPGRDSDSLTRHFITKKRHITTEYTKQAQKKARIKRREAE